MAEQLTELLNHQLTQLDKLAALQAEEKTALIERDAPALEQVTAAKETLLHAIQQTDRQIAEHPNREQLTADQQLKKLRADVQSLMEHCQQQNQQNGQLVQVTLGRIQHLRQSLQASQAGTTLTYTDKGKTTSGPGSSRTKA